MDTNDRKVTDVHALMLKGEIKSRPLSTVLHYSQMKNRRTDEMELNHVKVSGAGLVWWRLSGSRVRTAGRPTGSPQASGGAPPRASRRPWCHRGQSPRPRPARGQSCHNTHKADTWSSWQHHTHTSGRETSYFQITYIVW